MTAACVWYGMVHLPCFFFPWSLGRNLPFLASRCGLARIRTHSRAHCAGRALPSRPRWPNGVGRRLGHARFARHRFRTWRPIGDGLPSHHRSPYTAFGASERGLALASEPDAPQDLHRASRKLWVSAQRHTRLRPFNFGPRSPPRRPRCRQPSRRAEVPLRTRPRCAGAMLPPVQQPLRSRNVTTGPELPSPTGGPFL